jgi:hypothetical protein
MKDDILKIVTQIKTLFLEKDAVPTIDDLRSRFEEMKSVPPNFLASTLSTSGEEIDWDQVWYELETQIQVKHAVGSGLDDPNARYNKHWFTEFKKENKSRYYSDRFLRKVSENLSSEVLYTLQQDTEQVLNLLGSPRREEDRDIRGLVFGFVQAGKTLNYTSVSNAAMDAGYDLIVILAGATNILRSQTQERILTDLIGFNAGKRIGVGRIDNDPEKRPISLTTLEQDFDKKIAAQNMGSATLDTVKVPVIAVVKKNVNALKNLNKWLESQNPTGKIKKSILLIDDESDYASVNTKDQDDPTAINKRIREMLNHFNVSSYCAITATPFANVLIDSENRNDDVGSDLFPRSFIWTLDKPSTYMGVEEIVTDRFKDITLVEGPDCQDENDALVNSILGFKINHKKGVYDRFDTLPIFVNSALEDFLYKATKLRHIQAFEGDLSLMINLSRFTMHHQELATLTFEVIGSCKRQIENKSIGNCTNKILVGCLKRFRQDDQFDISEDKFDRLLEEEIKSVDVIDVHSESKRTISFTGKDSISHIVVGGLSLSRGFTVEGLIVSVFLRSTSTYDALMQMGRWFGHKQKFADYISLYTTAHIRRRFESIQRATVDLIKQLHDMRDKGATPEDFGLAIQLDPEVAMQVVAANKRRDADRLTISMSIEGKTCETTKLFSTPEGSGCLNEELVEGFVNNVFEQGNRVKPSPEILVPKDAYHQGRRNIPKEFLIEFIYAFQMPHKGLSELTSKMPYKFILEHLNLHSTHFDLFLVDGRGNELNIGKQRIREVKRLFDSREDYIQISKNQLSSGPRLESTFLRREMSSREDAAKNRSDDGLPPLLLLYKVLARDHKNEKQVYGSYWAWSLIIPGDRSKQQKKMVFGNSVLLRQLSLEEGFEDENEYLNQTYLNEE